jgi:hypothetical protein
MSQQGLESDQTAEKYRTIVENTREFDYEARY